jgi:hypothetical protein
MDGTETRARPHLSRARDGLEAHQEAIAQALEVRLAALRNRAVERMFSDTTSLPVDREASAWGVGEEACVEGRLGAKTSQAPRTRGRSPNGRGDAPPLVGGVAVTREGLPVRYGGFPGPTAEVSTGAPVPADLRGWQRSRCGLGGEAGMGSQEPLPPLSASGGSSILCMPMRRGDEGTREGGQRPGREPRVADNLRGKAGGGAIACATPPRQRHGSEPIARRACVRWVSGPSLAARPTGP